MDEILLTFSIRYYIVKINLYFFRKSQIFIGGKIEPVVQRRVSVISFSVSI